MLVYLDDEGIAWGEDLRIKVTVRVDQCLLRADNHLVGNPKRKV
jgi:hypothetical protein